MHLQRCINITPFTTTCSCLYGFSPNMFDKLIDEQCSILSAHKGMEGGDGVVSQAMLAP